MDIAIKPGTYIVAVSGGVDSMVLLDLLARQKEDLRLIVAHFEHGIRPDSEADFKLVQAAAKKYGLPFAAAHGKLGPDASEAAARTARYAFLEQLLAEEKADAIITAHHQDDVLETAILNMLRGTGRLGLSSLRSRDHLLRPLLGYSKQGILDYAAQHDIVWHEDSTNADERYLRNYIRHSIVPRLGVQGRAMLLERIEQARAINDQIDELLNKDIDLQPAPDQLGRKWFIQLPYAVSTEVMATWLRRQGITQFDRTLIDSLVVQAKTKASGKMADIDAGHMLKFSKENIHLTTRRN
ncbi:MAG TPA: tRNA lysidine(34) synthetase TilS [Candidatus Saccharimonadales bacterium]|nr:tRNA lysidine(34) synthetase TilS [Candidatus Saccharimonadales bacterium]